jgi:hypothetical protein
LAKPGRWQSMTLSALTCPETNAGNRGRSRPVLYSSFAAWTLHRNFQVNIAASALAAITDNGRKVCARTCEAFHREWRTCPSKLFPSICQLASSNGKNQMLRVVLSTVAVVGVLAAAHPVFADPLAATVSDHAQAAAAESTSPAPAKVSSPEAPAPTGFGWG